MSYGWATNNERLREHRRKKIERRYKKAGGFPTRYWSPEVHVGAFALPTYVQDLVGG
jgi:spermidine synthase